jgi:hypothetical protein
MKVFRPALIMVALLVVPHVNASERANGVSCADSAEGIASLEKVGYSALYTSSYGKAAMALRKAVALYSACPKRTKRADEAQTRQVLAGSLWHVSARNGAYDQLRSIKSLNDKFQFAYLPKESINAFGRRDYRRGYALLQEYLANGSSIIAPVGLEDSGAAQAMQRSLSAGSSGQFVTALREADAALSASPGSQMTRLIDGLANLAQAHNRRAHSLLFDALLGYDANPSRDNLLTFNSLMAAYILLAL